MELDNGYVMQSMFAITKQFDSKGQFGVWGDIT